MSSDKGKEEDKGSLSVSMSDEQKLSSSAEASEILTTKVNWLNSNKHELVVQAGLAILNGHIAYNIALIKVIDAYPIETRQAVKILKRHSNQAIDEGNIEGLLFLGWLYHQAQGDHKDHAKAISLYEKAITKGSAEAMYARGLIYRYGKGIDKDYQKAIKYFDLAILQGYAAAMYCRAHMYQYGQGGCQNYDAAIALYKMAIELNYADAMFELACMYKYARGVVQDYKQAIFYLDKAIFLGHSRAMCSRAFMYLHGRGCDKDEHIAAKLFLQSATTYAQQQLARCQFAEDVLQHNQDLVLNLLKQAVEPINKYVFHHIVSHKELLLNYILKLNKSSRYKLLKEIYDNPQDSQLANVFYTSRGLFPPQPGQGVLGKALDEYNKMRRDKKAISSGYMVFFNPTPLYYQPTNQVINSKAR